jgi:PleD family two-component response regulator
MGVAQLDTHGTLESLLKAADAALYRAKDSGRNAVSN